MTKVKQIVKQTKKQRQRNLVATGNLKLKLGSLGRTRTYNLAVMRPKCVRYTHVEMFDCLVL